MCEAINTNESVIHQQFRQQTFSHSLLFYIRAIFYPQVSLRWSNTAICGASLIDEQNLLSAAHCVTDDNGKVIKASSLTAVLGDLSVTSVSSTTIRRTVRYIFVHANYNTNTLQNDVAVLRVSSILN